MQNEYEGRKIRAGEKLLEKVGDCPSVQRFIGKYGKPLSRTAALFHLQRYLSWLRSDKGVAMSPDELVKDNLVCVFKSDPTDVKTKRKHMDWLDEFVNSVMVKRGIADMSRAMTASFVKLFYSRNDSNLFGDFSVALHTVNPPPPPLCAEDVRAVLKALPLTQRVPLLIAWQGGLEINRILSLTWADVKGIDLGEYPLKLQFFGRKKHRRTYHTYLGKDSIEGLKAWRERWIDLQKTQPQPDYPVFMGKGGPMSSASLNSLMREMALRLSRQDLVKNGNPKSWHSHFLRHSFETEGSHAGAKKEILGFFEGHVSDIVWTYNHRDELHEGDLVSEYLKIEPYVSLDYDEATAKEEMRSREKQLRVQYEEVVRNVEALKAALRDAGVLLPPSQPAP